MSTPTARGDSRWVVPFVDPELESRGSAPGCSRSRRSSRRRSPRTSTSSTRLRATCSTPAASGSGRCWSCSPPSSATRSVAEIVPAALVVELTHLATLYHDDVMDEADLRRGAQSANARWDNSVAILTGDFLFARASDIVADLGPEAVRIQAQTFARLVQGQIRETVGPRDGDDPLRALPVGRRRQDRLADRHVGPVRRARLGRRPGDRGRRSPSSASRSAPRSSSPTTSSTCASDTDDLGKTPGTDLREGVPTLPTLMAQAARPTRPTPGCSSCCPARSSTRPTVAEALTLLAVNPAMDAARDEVRRRSDEARAPAGPAARHPGPGRSRRPLRPGHHPHS